MGTTVGSVNSQAESALRHRASRMKAVIKSGHSLSPIVC